jgi:hypothetical protein
MSVQAIGSTGYYVNQAPAGVQTSGATYTSSPSFRAQPERDTVEISGKEKKKSNAAAWGILGTVATIGAAILCKRAHTIGGKMKANAKWYEKIGMGAKSLFRFNPKNIKTAEQLKDANWFTKQWHNLKGKWNKFLTGKEVKGGTPTPHTSGGGATPKPQTGAEAQQIATPVQQATTETQQTVTQVQQTVTEASKVTRKANNLTMEQDDLSRYAQKYAEGVPKANYTYRTELPKANYSTTPFGEGVVGKPKVVAEVKPEPFRQNPKVQHHKSKGRLRRH